MATGAAEHFLYEQLADKITHLIRQGTLRPGERIPSVRKLSRRENVSMSTVLQAYFMLEDRGLIEARPQSGFYVRLQPREMPQEPTISNPPLSASRVNITGLVLGIHESLNKHDMVPLGAATPSPELLPVRKLNRSLAAIARNSGEMAHRYAQTAGSAELRHQIARRSIDWGCSLSSEDIVVTFGCTEAVNLCLRAVAKPGDTIAVESPTYYGFLQIIESLQMKAVELPTDPRKGICLDALGSALRLHKVKALLLIPNFQNPLGHCMPDSRKKEVVEILARKEIPLIEDDIYGDLHFGNQRPRVCKSYDRKGLVLLCSSFSKCMSPGFRVGWTSPGRYLDEVKRLKLTNTLCTAAPTQMAIAEILSNGGYDRHLRKIRRAYFNQVQSVTQAISRYFPAETRVTRPSGGFVLWVQLPARVDSLQLYERALEKKISIAPGTLFSSKQHYRNFLRLNCAYPWSEKIQTALFTLGQLVRELQK